MDSNKIGKFILELRTEKHLSQYQLADMIPISRQAVSKWERGVTIPDSSTLICLSRIFNVSINELLNGERDTPKDLQETTLNIIDETNKETKALKRTIKISIIIITILLLSFLSYYFITSYNTTEVYKVGNDNGKFILTDGILIKTKEKLYIRLGNLKSVDDVEIKSIEYYYIKNNKERLIAKDKEIDELVAMDYVGYNEKGLMKDIKLVKKNSYLKITYDDNKVSILNLRYVKDFANDKLFLKKEKHHIKSISNSSLENEKEETKEVNAETKEEDNSKKEEQPSTVETKPKTNEVKQKTEEKKEEKPKTEDKKEEVKQPVEPAKEITPNEIINEIKSKGELFEGTYSYEHTANGETVTFYYFESLNQIMMEDSNEDSWTYIIQIGSFTCDTIFDNELCKEKVKSDVTKYLFS